jgi:hypothetical protein
LSIASPEIINTEMMESTAKPAASQNTAVKPNIQPNSPDNPAPTMLPA